MNWKLVTDLSIAILSAIVGAAIVPVFIYVRDRMKPSYDDRQSLVGRWACKWYIGSGSEERLYVEDKVEINSIVNSRFKGMGDDPKAVYKLEGYISRGSVISFYYITLSKRISLTGSGTLRMNNMGSKLEGCWYGYLQEDLMDGGRVVWERMGE